MIDGEVSDEDIKLAAQIAARYSQGKMADLVEVEYTDTSGVSKTLSVAPMPVSEIDAAWQV